MTDKLIVRIPKATGTHADVLTAVGLAVLLETLFDENITVNDADGLLEVCIPGDLSNLFETLNRLPHSPGYPWLQNEEESVPPNGCTSISMRNEFQRVKRWRDNQRQLKKVKLDAALLQAIQEDKPIPRWSILTPLTAIKLKGIDTWNRVAEAIAKTSARDFRDQVREGLQNLVEGRHTKTKWKATSNGLFCPPQIKGFNEIKPQGTSRGSMPVDPFEEWLRYQGYWKCATVVSMGDNIRIYVPIPMHVSSRAMTRLASELEGQPLWATGPKADILVVLALTRLLIERSEEYHASGIEPYPGLRLQAAGTPSKLISGLSVTSYVKTSRQAYGVESITALALPDWFAITSKTDAEAWLAILDEHKKIIRGLQDDHSDEIGLLIAYRRFLEKRGDTAIWSLVEFMERYGSLVMRANGTRQGGRVRWITRFTDKHLWRILMGANASLLEIINEPGFGAVARAVRQATVISQNKKARGEKVWREVRYGLLHDLHRTRKVPGNAFVERVSEFISHYNCENARRRETTKNPKAAPANVSDEELKTFIALVDRHGASLVGALLSAYGSCKEKWEQEDVETPDSVATTSDGEA
jgi:hypothetical protein